MWTADRMVLPIEYMLHYCTALVIHHHWQLVFFIPSQDPEIHSLVSSCGLQIGGLCEETQGRYWVIIVMCPAVVSSLEGINYQHLSQVAACHPARDCQGIHTYKEEQPLSSRDNLEHAVGCALFISSFSRNSPPGSSCQELITANNGKYPGNADTTLRGLRIKLDTDTHWLN